MKMKADVIEVENEGLISLIDEQVTFFCLNYFYTGKLVGVNDTCVKIQHAKIIYETGDFSDATWKDAQFLGNEFHYIQLSCIESFGVMK